MTFVNFLTCFQRHNLLFISVLMICCVGVNGTFAQKDSLHFMDYSPEYHKGRSAFVVGGTSALGVGLLGTLSYSWYKDFNSSSFHFFNDALEWRGMDKVGHAVTAYQVCDYIEGWYQWAGHPKKRGRWYSALTSFSFLAAVEVMDGFSDGWGFSNEDMFSNAVGIGVFLAKSKFSKNSSFSLKYGFLPSSYRALRPEQLGYNHLTSLIKDYNGQSYWLSFNLSLFTNSSKFPKWLNLAAGYGAEGLLGGKSNPEFNDSGLSLPKVNRYSQFFLSPDIDWTKIPTKSRNLKFVLKVLSFYKLPLPTFEANTQGKVKFHWFQ
ncbi:MAG: hypothetical protein ACJA0Q_000681 [Saprospiraceae bacterium]|jgi:hypothetical protein